MLLRAEQDNQLTGASTPYDALLDDSVFANVAPMLSVEQAANMLQLPVDLITAYINNGTIRGVISQPGFGTYISRPSFQLFWRQLCLGELGPAAVGAKASDEQAPDERSPIKAVAHGREEQLAFALDSSTLPANDAASFEASDGLKSHAVTVPVEEEAALPQPQPQPQLRVSPVLVSPSFVEEAVTETPTAEVKVETTPDYVNDIPALVHYLETTDFENPQRVSGVKYLNVRKNKYSLVLSVSVKMNGTNKGKDLVSLPINQPNNQPIDHGNVEAAMAVFKSFCQQYAAETPWGLINWNKEGKPKQRLVITTAVELLEFYVENKVFGTEDSKKKVLRYIDRYFRGREGQIDLRTIKRDEYEKTILEMPHAKRAKSDYSEVIKYTKAAYNFAKHHKDVEKLDFDNPVEGLKRDRGKPGDSPELSVYVRILCKAVELGLNEFAFSLLFQEVSFCRKALTCHMPLNMLDSMNWCFKIDVRSNKSNTTADYFIAPKFIPLLKARLEQLEREFGKGNKWLFPSPKTHGQHRSNFDNDFKKAKNAVLAEMEQHSVPNTHFDEDIVAVRSFTQHRLRALNEKLLQAINVYEAEKKNGFNHYLSDINISYGNLTNRRQREFKDEKFDSICEQFPEYRSAIETLTKRFQDNTSV